MRILYWLLLFGSGHFLIGQNQERDSAYWYFEQGKQYSYWDMQEETALHYRTAYDLYASREAWDSCVLSIVRAFSFSPDLWDQQLVAAAIIEGKQLASAHLEGDHAVWGDIFELEGHLFLRQGREQDSKNAFQKSLQIRQQSLPQNDPLIVSSHRNLVHVYYFSGAIDSAMYRISKALELSQMTDIDSIIFGAMLREKASLINYQAKRTNQASLIRESLSYFQNSQKILLQLPKSPLGHTTSLIGKNYLVMGSLFRQLDDFPTALHHYELAKDNLQQTLPPYHRSFAQLYSNLSTIYGSIGEAAQAASYAQMALDVMIFSEGRESGLVAFYYYQTAQMYRLNNEYPKAIEHINLGIALGEKTMDDNAFQLPLFYSSKGTILRELGNNEASINVLKKGIALLENSIAEDHPQMGKLYEELGITYHLSNKPKEAKKSFLQALERNQRFFGENGDKVAFSYYLLALTETSMGHYAKSLSLLDQSFDLLLPDHSSIPDELAFSEIPLAFQDQLPQYLHAAGDNYWQLYQETGEIDYLYQAKHMTKLILAHNDSLQIGRLDLVSQQHFLEELNVYCGISQKIVYELYRVTDSIHYIQEAFQISERSRSNVLRQAFAKSRSPETMGIPGSVFDQEKAFQDSLLSIKSRLEQLDPNSREALDLSATYLDLTLQNQHFLEDLKRNYPSYFQIIYDFEAPQLSSLQKNFLTDSQAIIEYFFGQYEIYVFVLTKDHMVFQQLPPKDEIINYLSSFREQLSIDQFFLNPTHLSSSTGGSQLASDSRHLYEYLIKPIETFLQEVDELVIIPDAELGFLPFEALHQSYNERLQASDFLLHRYKMSYAFSASLLPQTKSEESHNWSPFHLPLLVMAPSFKRDQTNQDSVALSRKEYFPLRFSIDEVNQISGQYKGSLLSGPMATKERFTELAPKSRIIHLATHAKAFQNDSDLSHIAFSSKDLQQSQVNHLFVKEIYTMTLLADMVVLSACETGLGELKKGEGIISLGRAFTYAGAKSIISTLWSVNDQSTSELMISFYGYLDQGMSKDAALRQAKLDYLDSHDANFSHPYFWAAPIAIGDMSPIQLRSGIPWVCILSIIALTLALLGIIYWRRRQKID